MRTAIGVALGSLVLFPLLPPVVSWWHRAAVAVAMGVQLLPLLALRALPRPVPPARAWIAAWGAIYFASDIAQLFISRDGSSNQWFIQLANPFEDAALLMAYSYWQLRPVLRLTFRVAIPLLAIGALAIALAADEVQGFKAASSPFRLIILSAAVAYTLVGRSVTAVDRIWRQDWFWISLGVVLHVSVAVLIDPISSRLYPARADLVLTIYFVKTVVDVLAFVLIYHGMRCPVEPSFSGSMSGSSLRSG